MIQDGTKAPKKKDKKQEEEERKKKDQEELEKKQKEEEERKKKEEEEAAAALLAAKKAEEEKKAAGKKGPLPKGAKGLEEKKEEVPVIETEEQKLQREKVEINAQLDEIKKQCDALNAKLKLLS